MMTDESRADGAERSDQAITPVGDPHRTIVRDETFSRCVADEVIPLTLGRDIELSFLQFSPLLNGVFDKGDFSQPDTKRVSVEVARVRMGWGEAVTMAMIILQQGIATDRVRGDKVAESIKEWASEASADQNEGDPDA